MRDELLLYYERELDYLRKSAAQFAEKYPKVASRLVLEPTKCEDPHVERLLEAFAFLAARIHLKLDDDFPEITEGLLSIVYPQLFRPIPSMSVVEFQLDSEKGKLGERAHDRSQVAVIFQADQRYAVLVSHLLRHHSLADHGEYGRAAATQPTQAAGEDQ